MSVESLVELLKLTGSSGVTVALIWLLMQRDKRRNGGGINAKTLAETVSKEVSHGLDEKITDGFDQLRRDLSATIERASDQGAKGMESAITKLLLQSELRRKR